MSNLLETLKKLGFEPDFPGNHLSLYLENEGVGSKEFAIIRIADYETEDILTDQTKKFSISIDIENGEGTSTNGFFSVVNSDEKQYYETALGNVLFSMNERNMPPNVAIKNAINTFGFKREIDFRQYVLTNPAFMQSE